MICQLLTRFFHDIRPQERQRSCLFFTTYLMITLGQTLGLAGSESLFLSHIGIHKMPLMLIYASLTTVLGSTAYTCIVGRQRHDTLFSLMLALSSSILLIAAYYLSSSLVISAIFCAYYLFQALLVNHFWNWASEYFDASSSKRIFPIFAIGSSLGGFLGALGGEVLNRWMGPNTLILGWGIVLFITAINIHLNKSTILGWGSLGVQENDDSLKGISKSWHYLQNSAFSRWLSLSVLSMILAMFLAQYLYQDIISASFPDGQSLATFMNIYLIATNLLEIVIEMAIMPRLLVKFGIPITNLVHPFLTIASFIALIVSPTLSVAILARLNRELIDNALASPVRTLIYNALPDRLRGYIRAFLEGIVTYSGMAGAGLLLYIFGQHLSPVGIAYLGAFLAVIYMIANVQALRHYLQTIVNELCHGHLDLDSMSQVFTAGNERHIVAIWNKMVNGDQRYLASTVRQLSPILAKLNIVTPLLELSRSEQPEVRLSIAKFLSETSKEASKVTKCLLELAQDSDDNVALQALKSLYKRNTQTDINSYQQELKKLLNHPNIAIVARAASLTGIVGQARLEKLVNSQIVDEVIAALEVTSKDNLKILINYSENSNMRVRSAAIKRLNEIVSPPPIRLENVVMLLKNKDPQIRRIACQALGSLQDKRATTYLASSLNDSAREVRREASAQLANNPQNGLNDVEPYLQVDNIITVQEAINTIAKMDDDRAIPTLYRALRSYVTEVWTATVCLERSSNWRFSSKQLDTLKIALQDHIKRNLDLSFHILEATTSNSSALKGLRTALRQVDKSHFGQALEILSNLEERWSTRLLVLYFEPSNLDAKIPLLPKSMVFPNTTGDIIAWGQNSDTRWLRLATNITNNQESTMERLLILRSIPLFKSMTLEQLEALDKIVNEGHYMAGEIIIREGEIGSELYMMISGKVKVLKNYGTPDERQLAVMSGISYFGEMAILDDEPRSATIIVEEDADILSLNGDELKELIHVFPNIACEIIKVLTQRIRKSENKGK